MGQAKQRGTFEERKAAAVDREQKRRMAMAEVARRRPSPKHVALIGMIAAMTHYNGQSLVMPARIIWPGSTFSEDHPAPAIDESNLLQLLLLAQQVGADVQYED